MNENRAQINRLVIIGDGKVYRYKGKYYDFGGYREDFFCCFDGIDEIYIFNRIYDLDEIREGVYLEIKCPNNKQLFFIGIENLPDGIRGYITSFTLILKQMRFFINESSIVMGNMIDVLMWMFWIFCRRENHIYLSRYPGDPEIFVQAGKPLGRLCTIIAKQLTRQFHKKCALQTFVSRSLMEKYAVKTAPSIVWSDFILSEKEIVNQVYISRTESFHILFVGRLSKEKGLPDLIDAIRILDNEAIHLTVIGDGEEKGFIQQRIRSKKVEKQVDLIGWVPWGERLFQYMREADTLVLPSRTEGLGLVLLEAMANGTTAIGSRVGGIPEIITDGVNGLLFEVGNVHSLAEKISLLYEDRDLLKRLSINGIETARQNVREIQIAKFHEAYIEHVFPKLTNF